MAAGEPTRQDPSALKELAAQTRGERAIFFTGGQIRGLSAAWTRSWQLLDSTLWSCWLVTELFSLVSLSAIGVKIAAYGCEFKSKHRSFCIGLAPGHH